MEKQGNAVRFNLIYTFEFEIICRRIIEDGRINSLYRKKSTL